ncbi:MAG: hypothetical protein ACYC66_18290 [Chloroflexota bacterium]
MSLSISRHGLIWLAVFLFLVGLLLLALPPTGSALPNYSAATGQPCTTCHVNPSGVGGLTALGQAFAAIPNHATDPAGAFAQASGGAAPAATAAPAAATPTRAAATPTRAAATPGAAAPAGTPAAATPGALPTTGESSAAAELPMVLALFGFVALGLGLTWGYRGARGR